MKYVKGDPVHITIGVHGDAVYVIQRVEPSLEMPYFLSNNEWYSGDQLIPYVAPTPTWEQVESHIKVLIADLRTRFKNNNEGYMSFVITANGRPEGDIKIKYSVRDREYGGKEVTGYSIRPTLDELFRQKKWVERNIPLVLTHEGGEGVADPDDDD